VLTVTCGRAGGHWTRERRLCWFPDAGIWSGAWLRAVLTRPQRHDAGKRL